MAGSIVKYGASAFAAIVVAVLSSRLSNLGTILGAGATAIVGGVSTSVYEHVAHKAPTVLKNRGFWYTFRHVPLNINKRLVSMAALGCVGVAGTSYAGITIAEAATGRTMHSITTGKPDYGTTLGGSSTQSPSPGPTITVNPSYDVSIRPTPSLSPSLTPSESATPSATETTPTPSTSPSPSSTATVAPSPIIPTETTSP